VEDQGSQSVTLAVSAVKQVSGDEDVGRDYCYLTFCARPSLAQDYLLYFEEFLFVTSFVLLES